MVSHLAPLRFPILAAACFSLFANLLMLAGPIYMLQVYDRVLSSGSVPTLVSLSLILLFLYLLLAVLDGVRRRIMLRVAVKLDRSLEARLFEATIRQASLGAQGQGPDALEEISHLGRFIAGPVGTTLFDLPWTPIFFAAIFLFHPLLGLLAVGGALALILFTLANQLLSKRAEREGTRVATHISRIAQQARAEAETLRGQGMEKGIFQTWQGLRKKQSESDLSAGEVGASFVSATRALRLALQSAMLGCGAWLVLGQEMTPGGMIAGSILLGRALSPIEALLSQWALIRRGIGAWYSLCRILYRVPKERPRTALPLPEGRVSLGSVTVVPPGEKRATLRDLSFELEPGQALGVIGPSGSGKTTLARILTGVWPATAGTVKLGGVPLDQYDQEALGRSLGYLPQAVRLFDGTLAQNIASLMAVPDSDAVIAAAQAADAHGMIADLPDGYDTEVRDGQSRLSGGQIQRIGLARALFGDPALLILDEPNSNLDNEGTQALNKAIRSLKQKGRTIVVMAHRPAAIQECELLLVLEEGRRKAFGAKEEVLASMVRNVEALRQRPSGTTAAMT